MDVEIPVRFYRPSSQERNLPLIVYFHGGGNIRGNIDTHDSTCRVLASGGGCAVLSVDYRLAPEHPFPAAVEDAATAVSWAAENSERLRCDGKRLIVGGDSAGANLAAVVSLRARDAGAPGIAAQMLIYPVIDHLADTESRRRYSSGYMLDSMPFYTASYLPNPDDRGHPDASPIHAADHSNLPPAYIMTAGYDPLHDEAVAYAEKLQEAGVRVDLVNYPEMIHGFTLLRDLLPEADQALADAANRVLALCNS